MEKIKMGFTVVNSNVDAYRTATEAFSKSEISVMSFKEHLKDFTLNTVRLALFQKIRNKKIHLFNLLLCPSCGSTFLLKISDSMKCNDCNTTYKLRRRILTIFSLVSENKRKE